MNAVRGTMRSRYMEWAKTRSQARFNLATSGIMNVPLAEFPVALDDLEITTSSVGYGYPPLQQRLAQHTDAPEECIVTATGTSLANHLAMAALISPGDEVLIEQPAYGPLLDLADYLGARVRRIARRFESGFALDPDELRAAMTPNTRLIVLTNMHNPSGALLSAQPLRAVGEIAQAASAQVLVDEVYLEMLFDREAPYAFPLWGEAQNPFVVTSSLTKAYGLSGLRCGWIIAAPELARRIWRLHDLFGSVAAHTAERMSVIALDHLTQFTTRAQSILAANRPLLDAFLDSRDDLDCFRPPAGTVVFPRLRSGETDAFLVLLREKYETTVVPGAFLELPDHFRIGIGGTSADLRAGLERIGAALDEFGKR
ncbi:MAG: pyridoxal phosphate-dependent aminotransferase [Verrucomicrobiota bacterium]|nr:pyridoxal phosphate-dependent aminotransferase [Verrucomicrobiota bacterium]